MSVEAAGSYLGELCQSADQVLAKWGKVYSTLTVGERFAQVDLIKGAGCYPAERGIAFRYESLSFELSDVVRSDGFGRLAELEEFLEVWRRARGWSETDLSCGGYLDAGWLLWRIWRERLVGLAGEVGELVKYFAYATPNAPLWTPSYEGRGGQRGSVRISTADLVEIADRSFPARSSAWVRAFYHLNLSGGKGGEESCYLAECELADLFEGFVEQFGADAWIMFLEMVATDRGVGEGICFTRVSGLMAGAVGV